MARHKCIHDKLDFYRYTLINAIRSVLIMNTFTHWMAMWYIVVEIGETFKIYILRLASRKSVMQSNVYLWRWNVSSSISIDNVFLNIINQFIQFTTIQFKLKYLLFPMFQRGSQSAAKMMDTPTWLVNKFCFAIPKLIHFETSIMSRLAIHRWPVSTDQIYRVLTKFFNLLVTPNK